MAIGKTGPKDFKVFLFITGGTAASIVIYAPLAASIILMIMFCKQGREVQVMIGSYQFGAIKINNRTYGSDIIVYLEKIDPNCYSESGHEIKKNDLQQIFDFNPELLVIGTSTRRLLKVDQKFIQKLKQNNIRYIIKPTPLAVEEYTRADGTNRAVSAFH